MIRRLRTARGWSQARLAQKLVEVSGRPTVTASEVSRWERGGRTPTFWMPHLAAVLGVRQETLELAGVGHAAPAPGLTLAELLPADSDVFAQFDDSAGRHVGADTVRDLSGRVHGLRLADDVLAGGDLIRPAFRELSKAVQLYRESAHTEDVGRAMLIAIGELAQIAGWIASDAGQICEAERAYRIGISAAREAQDGNLAGNLMGTLAYQYANTGRVADAVTLAAAAVDEAGPDAPARARALYLDRVAWANTKAGKVQEVTRALGEAGQAYAEHEPGADEPGYLYWVDAGELKVMEARAYTELQRPLRAVPLLNEVLAQYDATHAREMALYLSWLAIACADANEPEQAAENAQRMLRISADVASERTAERARVVLRRLEAFFDLPEVAQLFEEFGHLIAA